MRTEPFVAHLELFPYLTAPCQLTLCSGHMTQSVKPHCRSRVIVKHSTRERRALTPRRLQPRRFKSKSVSTKKRLRCGERHLTATSIRISSSTVSHRHAVHST